MKERKTNLELLRIICMLLLIGHHCVVHGTGVPYNNPVTFNKVFALFMIPAGKICFMAFLALSTWFMSDQTFRAHRFIRVWMQVFFYSILFTFFFAMLAETPLSKMQIISSFFPIIGNSHGFASAYLALYLLLPFLAKIVSNITKRQVVWLIVLLVYFQMISQYFSIFTGYAQRFPSEITLFVLCFFISYYLKHWMPQRLQNVHITGGIFLVCWGLMGLLYIINYKNPDIAFVNYILRINGDEFGFVNIISGYMMFFTFKNINMNTNRLINAVAKTTFGVLLIHDHNFFRPVVWTQIIKTPTWNESPYFTICVLVVILFIFIVCIFIDKMREFIFDKWILKSPVLVKLGNKMDNWIS